MFIGGADWRRSFKKDFDILENKDKSGIAAGMPEVIKTMQLNLGNI